MIKIMKWFKKLFNRECNHLFDLNVKEVQTAMGSESHAAFVCVKCGFVDQGSIVRPGTGVGMRMPILSEGLKQKINY